MFSASVWILLFTLHVGAPVVNIQFHDKTSCENALHEILEYWKQLTDDKMPMAVCVPYKG